MRKPYGGRVVLWGMPRRKRGDVTTVVSFGGGTNSTAMLVGLHEREERPDLILFADTGGEKPHTYEHVTNVCKWCQSIGFPPITRLPSAITLEQDCLNRKSLPSIAFGFKTCSQRFKARPQDNYLRDLGATDVVKLIGFDADEPHRAKPFPRNRYPLIEWGWGRDECVEAIARAGLKQPGKSACFFCPSSKKAEILELKRVYPDLLDRAVAMENNADLTTIKGLGRDFAWRDLVKFDAAQLQMFPDSNVGISCDCYDEAA